MPQPTGGKTRGTPLFSFLLSIPLVCVALLYIWAYGWSGSGASASQPRSMQQRAPAAARVTALLQANAPAWWKASAPQDCPAWIAEYSAFHRWVAANHMQVAAGRSHKLGLPLILLCCLCRQHRGAPGAKYLVYSACPGQSGLGDRIRGMMYLTRQAVATGRVVLFTWRDEPHAVERYLPPAGIDWSLDGIEGYDYPDLSSFCGNADNFAARSRVPGLEEEADTAPGAANGSHPTNSIVLSSTDYKARDTLVRRYIVGGGLKDFEDIQFVTIHTNEWSSRSCKGCPTMADPAPKSGKNPDSTVDVSAACLFRQLFRLRCVWCNSVRRLAAQLYSALAHGVLRCACFPVAELLPC